MEPVGTDVPLGRGWHLAGDGKWYPAPGPHRPRYGGARTVSTVFKATAWLVLIGGTISAIQAARTLHNSGATSNTVTDVVLGIVGGTILTAAAMGFFAYVLDLLVGIEENTSSSRTGTGQEVGQPSTDHPTPTPDAQHTPVYPEPGWYSDPNGVARWRYWNGEAWTQQTQGSPLRG